MPTTARVALLVFVSISFAACSTMYSARISVARPDPAPTFTQQERDAAKDLVVEIARAAGFAETDPGEAWDPYAEFVALSGKGSEQDTVTVSGLMRADRREILIAVGDWMNGEPLPTTRKLVDDLRAALERAIPDAQVAVTTRNKPRILGP